MKLFAKHFLFHAFTWYFIFLNTSFIYCPSLYGKFLNIIHEYICSLIIFLGPLYGYYRTNILLILSTIVGWFITGSCFITIMTNKACNDPNSTPFENCAFHVKRLISFFTGNNNYASLPSTTRNIDYAFLFFAVTYNLYMIWLSRKLFVYF